MIGERTERGWEVRLRSRGFGRFFGAGFLAFWLCGWAVGEVVVLWILVGGARAFLLRGGPQSPGAAIAIGLFLIVWLAGWTFGGIMALRELFRLLWGEDLLIAAPDRLTIVRRMGPFRSRRDIPRSALRRMLLRARTAALQVETTSAVVDLTGLGSPTEHEQIRDQLTKELRLEEHDPSTETGSLPRGWQELITPEGQRALVPDLGNRRIQARIAAGVTMVGAMLSFLLAQESMQNPSLIGIVIIVLVGTLGLAAGTMWLARGRMEWRVENSRIVLQRRYGSSLRDVFEARRLEITISTDSDNDDWFALEAVNPQIESEAIKGRAKGRKTIARTMNEEIVPRRLGAWLSSRSGIPLEDRTKRESRVLEIAQLRAQLPRPACSDESW